MKLGIHIGYGGGHTTDQQLHIVRAAEELGYDSVWTAEAYGTDAATPLAWLAGNTKTIKLGSAIMQMPGRTPAMTAMTAVTIDVLSEGRMLLGLGASGPQVAEGWHGQRFAPQLKRTREYITLVKKALARERLEFDGEIFQLPLSDGPGKPLRLMIQPIQEHIPIFLAAIGPKNTALAAEIADGWMPTLLSPQHISLFEPALQEGAQRSDRSLENFEIAATASLLITDDIEAAHNALRPYIALYVGGMGSRKQNFYNKLVQRYGFEQEASEIQELYLSGKKNEAAGAVPEALVDLVSLCGPEDQVREQLQMFADAGVTTLIVSPVAWDVEERIDQLRQLIELL